MPGEVPIRAALELAGSLGEVREKPLRMNAMAFHALYERTARPLFNYLLRVSGRRDIAEDVLQESYCRVLSAKLPEMDEAQTRSYLFKIATNLLRDRWRRNEETAMETLNARGAVANHSEQAALRQAFDRLKLRERELLWLAYVEGASHKEIADRTGLKPGSIRLLLHRARRRLAGLIRGDSRDQPKGDA
jgi:RNA polymerase sigma-70 factor (ECF subfamily)